MIKTEFGTELKKKLVKGINTLNDSVSSTLGPGGRNVIISDENGNIRITKDGVSVAKAFDKLEDPVENIGAQMIKKVSEKSADKAGDGTTTSTLLATVMVNEGMKLITQGSNAVEVKKGMDKAVANVIGQLKNMSADITTEEQIKQVATISANNDSEVGILISTALDKVGNDGIVAIEESKTGESYLEVVEGMMFERGYKSPYFVTNQNTMECILEKPLVFLYNGRISGTQQILPVLQAAANKNQPLLIVAEDIEGEALALMVVNKANNVLKACGVKAPDFGDRRTARLEDIAVLTGATVVSKEKGHELAKMKPDQVAETFGECRMSTVTSKDTTLIDGKGDQQAISDRIMELKDQIDRAKSAFEIESLQDRLGKLTGGVAIVYVGGMSEVELKEKKDRVDDALHATKAALEQGIVPGGGMALIDCVEGLRKFEFDNEDQRLGGKIVEKALYAPFGKILNNSGIENPFEVLSHIMKEKESQDKYSSTSNSYWVGYNAKTGEVDNLFEAGVIDPTKVTKTALENAVSVAGTIITTESIVYHFGEESKKDEIDYSQFMQ